MRKTILSAIAAAALAVASTAAAGEQTSAVMSPKCDAEKLKELADGAISKAEPNPYTDPGIYNVTLDTSKMTFADLMKKMVDADCM